MKIQKLAAMLLAAAAVSLPICADTPADEEVKLDHVYEAYDEFLQKTANNFPADTWRFDFAYIDTDNIPEILVALTDVKPSEEVQIYRYTENGEVVFVNTFGSNSKMYYIPGCDLIMDIDYAGEKKNFHAADEYQLTAGLYRSDGSVFKMCLYAEGFKYGITSQGSIEEIKIYDYPDIDTFSCEWNTVNNFKKASSVFDASSDECFKYTGTSAAADARKKLEENKFVTSSYIITEPREYWGDYSLEQGIPRTDKMLLICIPPNSSDINISIKSKSPKAILGWDDLITTDPDNSHLYKDELIYDIKNTDTGFISKIFSMSQLSEDSYFVQDNPEFYSNFVYDGTLEKYEALITVTYTYNGKTYSAEYNFVHNID